MVGNTRRMMSLNFQWYVDAEDLKAQRVMFKEGRISIMVALEGLIATERPHYCNHS